MRENANSNPVAIAITVASRSFLNSNAASVANAAAAAEKNADARFARHATERTGSIVKKCVTSTNSGKPGGCALPSDHAASVSSPLSISATVGAIVKR